VSEVANFMPTVEQIRKSIYHLRRASDADEGFLLELYTQGRAAELLFSGMDAMQREVFLQMQFRARQASYLASYPEALDEIICLDDGAQAGRVLVDRSGGGMRLVDIAVVDARQRQGLGTQVIQALQQECRAQGAELKLQVIKESAAERLYRQLGFTVMSEDSLRRRMVWNGERD
jgi:N-acetylglutamate synthase-like GNAT family acetyltransferase